MSPGPGSPAAEDRAWKNSKRPLAISSGPGAFVSPPASAGTAPRGACQAWAVRFKASSHAAAWLWTQSANTTLCALSGVFSFSVMAYPLFFDASASWCSDGFRPGFRDS